MATKRVLPPTYLLLAILVMVGLHLLLPAPRFIAYPWNFVGVVPVGLGLAVAVIADRAFKRHRTTVNPFEEPSVLVTVGLFRISRNPMYLGFVVLLAGIALLMGSLSPPAVVVVFAVLMDRIFIRAEERMLETVFGEDWLRYKGKVRRWI